MLLGGLGRSLNLSRCLSPMGDVLGALRGVRLGGRDLGLVGVWGSLVGLILTVVVVLRL